MKLSAVGWGPRQPDLMGGKPAHGKGLELDDFGSLSTQDIL